MGNTMSFDGNGPRLSFGLDDGEVLALVRAGTITLDSNSPQLVAAVTVWRKLQMRAEDILNEQRANSRFEIPTDPALDTGCEGCE